jgi:hypothetical protein
MHYKIAKIAAISSKKPGMIIALSYTQRVLSLLLIAHPRDPGFGLFYEVGDPR